MISTGMGGVRKFLATMMPAWTCKGFCLFDLSFNDVIFHGIECGPRCLYLSHDVWAIFVVENHFFNTFDFSFNTA